jgi:uncharacterized membrane protein YbhN (UPF0104 family)
VVPVAWHSARGRCDAAECSHRKSRGARVAFFLLTSLPNVTAVILIGSGLAVGILGGEPNLLLTAVPAAVAALAIVAVLLAGRFAERWEERLQRRARPELSRRARALWNSLAALADGVNEALALLREGNAVLILGLLAYMVFDVMILWAAFRALGPAPPVANLTIGYLLGQLGGLIPVPGGIGGVDAGLVGTLVLYRVPIAAAAGAVLAYRVIGLWVPAIVGGAAFVALRRTLRREADKVAVCAPQTEMEIIGLGSAVIRPEAR